MDLQIIDYILTNWIDWNLLDGSLRIAEGYYKSIT